MKQLLIGVLIVVGLAVSFGSGVSAASDLDSLKIISYQADMTLGRDSQQRSTLRVKETITAYFLRENQNHGLERTFVKDCDGHSLSFKLESVTNQYGENLKHHWSGDNLRIGEEDVYVYGWQTYVITYSMRDVTRFFQDIGRDELYWDVLGVDWRVPIETATLQLTIDPPLREALTGDSACYVGSQGATNQCQLESNEGQFVLHLTDINPYEGVTMAIGFEKGTFAAYQRSLLETLLAVWMIVQLVVTPLGIIYLTVFLVKWYGRLNRQKELGTIVPEYIPPTDASVLASSRLSLMYRSTATTAQMLDLAVRHYIKIYEVNRSVCSARLSMK